MRILYVTNGFPYPLTSGYLRHYHLIRGLSRRHSVSLFSLVGGNFRPEHLEALAPFTVRVHTFRNPGAGRSKLGRAVGTLRSLIPGAHGDPQVRELRATLHRSVSEEPFDVALFSGKQTYPALAGLRDVPVVADLCDATSVRIRGRIRHSGIARAPVLWAEYLQVRAVERRLIRDARHLLFASCRDREALMGRNTTSATIVPNGVDLDYWSRRSQTRGTRTIVMTGAMDYAPNRDAASYLIGEIFPRVRRELPDARLFVVGRDAPPWLVRMGARAGAHVTGLVPDVRPYLEEASVFVAPLRFAAGIQNKLLEAMAMGVPVVTSSLAADGLRTEDGHVPPVAVARTTSEFVERIVRQLAENRRDPDHEARQYVERHFVWSRSTETLDRVLAAVARGSAL